MVFRREPSGECSNGLSGWFSYSQKKLIVFQGHGWDVKCVQWHPSKGLLVSGSKDNQIKFWDPRTSTVLSTLYVSSLCEIPFYAQSNLL